MGGGGNKEGSPMQFSYYPSAPRSKPTVRVGQANKQMNKPGNLDDK